MRIRISEARSVSRVLYESNVESLNISGDILSFRSKDRLIIRSGMVVNIETSTKTLTNMEIVVSSCVMDGDYLNIRLQFTQTKTFAG